MGAQPIRKLPPDVVNRIAAAEIIHRPSNAIKELLENALDAGATTIRITAKEGGLKMLQVVDNGCGIARDDLPLLCERYATSKLRQFQDLQTLSTYGFRGEALASVSYCSHLEVVTKTKEEACGWRAQFENGEMINEPKPTGANDGTVITATDLFYNMPLRKRAFRSPSDEYSRILDVVTKYAIHNPEVAWVCKKASSVADLSTNANATSRTNISQLYSATLANQLIRVPDTVFDARLGASCCGWISDGNSNWARRGGFILFINISPLSLRTDSSDRLVDSPKLKKAVEALYAAVLAKGSSPFIYLSLHVDATKIDVNVHPTKSEVHFLNEDEIVASVVGTLQSALAGANITRTFAVQTVLPSAPTSSNVDRRPVAAPNYKIRMDPSNRTLHSMVTVTHPSQLPFNGLETEDTTSKPFQKDDTIETDCAFTSVQELRHAILLDSSSELCEVMNEHAFVGIVDERACLMLVQHATKLYLVNYAALGDEHFYQLGLRQFGGFGRLRLDPAPALSQLLEIAAEAEGGLLRAGLSVDAVVTKAAAMLMERSEMLDEYFSLTITPEGNLESIPIVLKGFTPDLNRLPHFLLCVATQVDWDDEKRCFETVLRELAFFYSPRPFAPLRETEGRAHRLWQFQHVLLPSFRRTAWPRKLKSSFRQVANLPDLFRVFERC